MAGCDVDNKYYELTRHCSRSELSAMQDSLWRRNAAAISEHPAGSLQFYSMNWERSSGDEFHIRMVFRAVPEYVRGQELDRIYPLVDMPFVNGPLLEQE